MGRIGGCAANPAHLSINQRVRHCEELVDEFSEWMIDIESDEAISY